MDAVELGPAVGVAFVWIKKRIYVIQFIVLNMDILYRYQTLTTASICLRSNGVQLKIQGGYYGHCQASFNIK